jgi:hypothetical protein
MAAEHLTMVILGCGYKKQAVSKIMFLLAMIDTWCCHHVS